jgi:S1-C subfamily serine protease
MKRYFLFLIFSVLSFSWTQIATCDDEDKIGSVVKIYTVSSFPSYYQPWQNNQQESSTGSGSVIEGKYVLTNAHVVENATLIMLRKDGNPKKYVAKVLFSGDECDLSLLSVEDPEFFEGTESIEIGDIPELQNQVAVFGYPIGGDNISITKGVVSRIEPHVYSHSNRNLLSIQIDAAINSGNSGGPVIKDGKLVGVAFQSFSGDIAQNVGYMIPSNVVKHFLKDIKDGKFDGFPDINIMISSMENPDIKKWAKMSKGQSGVLITDMDTPEKNKGIFKLNDVILSLDGVDICDDGTAKFRNGNLISFEYMLWDKQVGETCRFKILRDGKELEFNYLLSNPKKLVSRLYNSLPSYYIFGGLVFVPLTSNYIDSWKNSSAPMEMLIAEWYGKINDDEEEIVILTEVLPDDINIGYHNLRYKIVKKINSEKPKRFQSFVDQMENLNTEFVEIILENEEKIVLDVKKAKDSNSGILTRYRINSSKSADIKSTKQN